MRWNSHLDCQGGERCWNQTGEGSNCLLNVEMEGIQEPKPQQDNQSARVSINGHVSSHLRCRDLASNPARYQKTEDIPDEMPLGHCRSDPVGQTTRCRHIGGDWGATSRITTKVEEAPVVRTPTKNARPLITEAASKMQTKRKEEEARRDISAMDRSD